MLQHARYISHLIQHVVQAAMANSEYRARIGELRDDPELKKVFDEIASKGPEALDKYWHNSDLMSKISQRMTELQVKAGGKKPAAKIDNLHAAAKAGDVEAIKKFIAEGADIHEQVSSSLLYPFKSMSGKNLNPFPLFKDLETPRGLLSCDGHQKRYI